MTALGIDNTGDFVFPYGKEDTDYYVDGDPTSDYVFRVADSVFFCRLRDLFPSEMQAMFKNREEKNAWNSDSLIKQWDDAQAQFPEELWRLDYERKYYRTYLGLSIDNSIAKGIDKTFLIGKFFGRKKYPRRAFEINQEMYFATKYFGNKALSDVFWIRGNVPIGSDIAPNYSLTLVPYSDMYVCVQYTSTGTPIHKKVKAGETCVFENNSDRMDFIYVYAASFIQEVGDLSRCYVGDNNFSSAIRLQKLVIGSTDEGYENTFMKEVLVENNPLLEYLDLRNISGINTVINVSGCSNLKELYAEGTNATGVIFANGGLLETAHLPGITSLSMKNLYYVQDFIIDTYDNLQTLIIENTPNVNTYDIINSSPILKLIRLINLNWDVTYQIPDSSIFDRLLDIDGIDSSGYETDLSVLTGTVYLPSIGQQDFYRYQQAWPDLEITYTSLIAQYTVTFVNTDGTVLDKQYVNIGEAAEDPTTREENPIAIPTQASTAQYDYTFSGWDLSLSGVFTDRIITATYTPTVRSYTIKYVSKGTVLQEDVGNYGDVILYRGDIPTYTLEESAYVYYLFNRWDKSGYIDGDKTVNAIYDSCSYLEGYFDGKELKDLTPVEIYALTKAGVADTVITDKDPYDVQIGHDYDFDDVQSYTFIDKATVFDGTNCIDTGISLFDIDRDFVFVVDYKIKAGNTSGATMCQCYNSNGSNGFKLWYNTSPRITWGTQFITTASVGTRNLVVFQHKKGDTNITVYEANSLNNTAPTVTTIEMSKAATGDNTIVFGCARADDGIYENYCLGTVYWAKLWMGNIGDELCNNLALWTHQTMPMEAAGLRRYYLSDNSNQRCTFTLIAKYLLDQTKQLNSTATNAGGWKATALCAWLNERLYKAFPTQIRALMKQCKIPSSLGEKSPEIVYADCYVTIPSYIELVSTTGEVLINEGSTISFMTSNEERGRTYLTESAEFKNYWYRSPHLNGSTSFYYFHVWYNSSNNTYSYNATASAYAYDTRGVLIMISF